MVHLIENELLYLQTIDRFMFDHYILPNALHGKVLFRVLKSHQVNLTKCSSSNDRDELELIPTCLRDGTPSEE